MKTRALTLGKSILSTQSQWYHGGSVGNANTSQSAQWVFSTSGFACLMAGVYRAGGYAKADIAYYNDCVESFDYAINNLMDANGVFIDEPGSGATGLETVFFTAQLAWGMYLLDQSLDHARRKKWLRSLKANVDWIESTSNFRYWINGNWVVNAMRMLYHTKAICKREGDTAGYTKYAALYELQYAFMTNPTATSSQWVGYGVNIDSAGGQGDWSDTGAHLTELAFGPPMPNGGAGTSSDGIAPFGTFDGDYTGLSLEHASIWFVSSRDFRALKLLNGLANKFFSLVHTTGWTGDFGHGSRHDNPGYGIFSPSLAVLQLLGERQSNAVLRVGDVNPFTDALVLDNWDNRMIAVLSSNTNGSVPIGFVRSIGNIIPVILLACEQAQIKL